MNYTEDLMYRMAAGVLLRTSEVSGRVKKRNPHYCRECTLPMFLLVQHTEYVDHCVSCVEKLERQGLFYECDCCGGRVVFPNSCRWCRGPICDICHYNGEHSDTYECYSDPLDDL